MQVTINQWGVRYGEGVSTPRRFFLSRNAYFIASSGSSKCYIASALKHAC